MTSIRRGNFDVDFDFQNRVNINKFSTWIFYVVSMLNRRNLLFPFYHFLTCHALGTYSKLIWYSAESMSDIRTIGTIYFRNFATTQINKNKDNFYLL